MSGRLAFISRNYRLIALLALCSTVLVCVRNRKQPLGTSAKPLPRIDYVTLKRPSGPVILFVHGLMGDSKATWTNEESGAYWPELVAKEGVTVGSTVATYSYRTAFRESSLDLDEHARQMREVLRHEGLLNRDFIFINHSMGGLLVRRFLLSQPDLAENHVQMLFYASTPFSGAQLAACAVAITPNPTVQQLLRSQREHSWLDEQNARWLEAGFATIPAYTAYETQDYMSFRVVDEASAALGATRKAVAFAANHVTICKPRSNDALIHKYFINCYSETSSPLTRQSTKAWPSEAECMDIIGRSGVSRQELLNPQPELAKLKEDVTLTVLNGSRRRVGIVFCNVSTLYDMREGSLNQPFFGIDIDESYGSTTGKLFSRLGETTGWFLVFARYRDEGGEIVDRPYGLHYLLGTQDPYISISHTDSSDTPIAVTVSQHTPAP